MDITIYGIRKIEIDEKLYSMLQIKKACDKINVQYPQEAEDFFEKLGTDVGLEEPELLAQLGTVKIESKNITDQIRDSADGCCFEIDVTKIPELINFIRFDMSW